ncbi:MAG: hypothetical protein QM778_23440 [Myxococcales bacterium]
MQRIGTRALWVVVLTGCVNDWSMPLEGDSGAPHEPRQDGSSDMQPNPVSGDSGTVCDANCGGGPRCGDGIVQDGEACDGAGERAECNFNCTIASCGDGVANHAAGEDCDSAGQTAQCESNCKSAVCGDGVLNLAAGEECDDGKDGDDLDGCTDTCKVSCSAQRECPAGSECVAPVCRPFVLDTPQEISAQIPITQTRNERPALAMDGLGNALVIYSPEEAGKPPALEQIWYKSGTGWASHTPFLPNENGANVDYGLLTRLASDGKGGMMAVWHQGSQTLPATLMGRRGTVAGFADAFDILAQQPDRLPYGYRSAQVALDGDGNACLAWPVDEANSKYYYSASCPAGSTSCWGQVGATVNSLWSSMQVACHGNNRTMLAYLDNNADDTRQEFHVAYDHDASWSNDLLLDDVGMGMGSLNGDVPSAVVVDALGRTTVISVSGDYPNTAIKLTANTCTDGFGTCTWTAKNDFPVSRKDGTFIASLTGQPNGRLFLVYADSELQGQTLLSDYRVATRGPNAADWEIVDELAAKDIVITGDDAMVSGSDASGNALIAWTEKDGTMNRLFYSHYVAGQGFKAKREQLAVSAAGHVLKQLALSMQNDGHAVLTWVDESADAFKIWAAVLH